MLGDVFGISHLGEVDQRFSYVAPADGREALFDGYNAQYPLGIDEVQTRVEARPGAEVWATTSLPYSDPDDWERFTSIHSDPPGTATGDPAVAVAWSAAAGAIGRAARAARGVGALGTRCECV